MTMFQVSRTRAALYAGKPCPYCKRPMDASERDLSPTRDHHPVPRSKGGRRTITCCAKCNGLKGDMSADEWALYMAANPGWWTLTRRERQARKREAERTEKWGPRASRVIRQPEKPSTPLAEPLLRLKAARELSSAFHAKFEPKTE